MEAKKVTNPPSLREGKGVGPIVFATNNLHKLQEIRHILGNEIEVKSLSDIGCDADIPETGSTLEENARQKAEYVWQNYHCDVFADDTGLEVEALSGAPGVYSARYASLASPAGSPTAEAHDSEANMARLLHEMEYADNRRARFRTVIALIRKRDVCPCGCTSIKEEHLFEGIVNGEIKRERSGVGGFGYDPIFLPDGSSKTFAEMSEEEKNQISHRGRATAKLCAFLRSTLLLLTVIFSLFTSPVMAQIGTWHAYMSYNEPQQIVAGGHQLFVRASNSLYSYNLNDHSITTYDKVTSLSDTHVSLIAWNKAAQRLIIVYDNSNIDLMDSNGTVTNISALFLKSMTQDKTVNTIFCSGVYAYLGTGFGVVKVNMERAEISESYILSMNVTAIGTDQTSLYIRDKDGYVLSGNMSSNLIDPHKWSAATAPDGIFEADNSDWDEYAELVKALSPDGPKSNHFEYMTFLNDRLYTCSGGTYEGNIQLLQDGEWTFYQDTDMKAISGLDTYKGVVVLAVDPENPDHVYAGARNGLYEFQEGKLINQYNHANSPLGMYKGERAEVQMITGLAFDGNGNLWVLESQDVDVALLKLDTKTGQWTTADLPELMQLSISGMPHSLGLLKNIVIDKQGYVWFINDHYDLDSFYCVDPQTMKFVNRFESFTNQDGTTYADYRPHCLVEDFDGNLWLGTKVGPFMLDRANLYTKDTYLTQVKVPRNDGSDYADYLLSGANVSAMAIDGGNRKWIGTSGTGVYLISADNMEQIHNFTTANSPLLSDNILSIAIDPKTGEVFFGTDQGLCSYNSDATVASIEMENDNVYAYPNPVVSGYNGLITVVGLSFNADVKVLTTSGQLVAQGRSNGGTFTWDGRDRQGRRVASGVYMVAAATSEGKKGVVCKIAVIN